MATVAVAAVAFAGAFAWPAAAVTFIGRDVPTTVTIAPGATAAVPWTYQNTGGDGRLPASGMTAVFTAPGSTTFAAQTDVPTEYSADGSSWGGNNVGLRNCALSNGNKTLTCEGYGLNGAKSGWPANSYFRFSPQVTVDATAPSYTTLPPGNGSFTYNDSENGTEYTITDGTLNVETSARPGMCLDIGNTRNNSDNARIWQCLDHTNQRFVLDNGQVKVADTVGTGTEMCLSTPSTRNNSDNVFLWPCATSGQAFANQNWILYRGSFALANTFNTSNPMCLDVGNSRNNGDNAFIYRCSWLSANQTFVVDRGYIKVKNTL